MFKTKKSMASDVIHDTAEVAHSQTGKGSSNWPSILLSVAALFLSAISLYQTVLKQANMQLFVPETISYTRDAEGGYEVFILPLTITNNGARDGVVSALKLEATNNQTGKKIILKASYLAKSEYFIPPKAGATSAIQRPKEPFSPIPVAGHSAFGGTILFYPEKADKEIFMKGEGTYEFTLSAKTNTSNQNSFWSNAPKPRKFTATSGKVAPYFSGWIGVGNTWRMNVKEQ